MLDTKDTFNDRPAHDRPAHDRPAQNLTAFRDESLDYLEIAAFFRRYWKLICGAALSGLLMAATYVLSTTTLYTARAQLLLDPSMAQQLPRSMGELLLVMDTPLIDSQIALLRSEGIVTAVLAKLNLLNDPEFAAGWRQTSPKATSSEGADFERMRAAILNLQDGLFVHRIGLSHAIEISFSSRDPDKAARIANELAEAYIRDQIATKALAARQGSEWLETRIEHLRSQMNAAVLAVQEFRVRRDYRIVPKRDKPDGEQKMLTADAGAPRHDPNTLEELEATAKTYRTIYESWLQSYTEATQRLTLSVSSARVWAPMSS